MEKKTKEVMYCKHIGRERSKRSCWEAQRLKRGWNQCLECDERVYDEYGLRLDPSTINYKIPDSLV